jgi:transcriptional regulator NrdR family protein
MLGERHPYRKLAAFKNAVGQRGIACSNCGCAHFYTTHTEPLPDGRIRRRKQCRHCGKKVITFESGNGG